MRLRTLLQMSAKPKKRRTRRSETSRPGVRENGKRGLGDRGRPGKMSAKPSAPSATIRSKRLLSLRKRLGYEIAEATAKCPRNRTRETISEDAKLETDGESVEKKHASAFWWGVIRLDRALFSRFFRFPACFFREDCYIIFSFRHGIPSILPDGVMVAQVILVHLV